MYATVRRYTNAGALGDAMASMSDDVKQQISAVSGFVNYYATRDGDTITSVSVCDDKAGCDESTRIAAGWVREHVTPLPGSPEISGGEVFLNFSK